MSKKKEKYIWAAWASLFGLTFKQPKKCLLSLSLNTWWYKGGYEVKKVGFECRDGYMCFSSYSKKDIELWIAGFRAAGKVVNTCTRSSL